MTDNQNSESEIKSWLRSVLSNERLKDFSVNIVGGSNKGDGYVGDIVFVYITGIMREGGKKDYSLVLKCSKRSQALREQSPVKEAFLNEIYVYNKIFPSFTQFQLEKGIQSPFNSVPKCYGTLTNENMELIVLENLKSNGYILWDRTKPLTRKHIDMIVDEYGKFHAVSLAMQNQQPERFKELADGLEDVLTDIFERMGMLHVFEATIDELYELLQSDLDEHTLRKLKKFKQDIGPFIQQISLQLEGIKVILHGDCWNNNFMYLQQETGIPSKVAFLDWQVARLNSPILDLSYFIFTCISKEDLEDIDVILINYYDALMNYTRKLGTDPNKFYTLNQFLDDWKKYSKFGVFMTIIITKYSLAEEDEVPDMARSADVGEDISKIFLTSIKNTTGFKNRMSYIIKHVVEAGLI